MEIEKMFNNLDNRCIDLLKLIFINGKSTNAKLLDSTKMKKSTLIRSMKVLVENNLIVETAPGESTGGRRPSVFDVNTKSYFVIGVDISRTYVDIVVTDLKMNIVNYNQIKAYSHNGVDLKAVLEVITNVYNEASVSAKIIGIGMSIVGIENYFENNIKVIKAELYQRLKVSIFIEHGANAAVMLEYFKGCGKQTENMSYINCGVGIRTGSICNGRLIKNVREDAFGHNIIDIHGRLCNCGNYGCLQQYVCINEIERRFSKEMKKWGEHTALDYKSVCDLAERNNEVARYIIKDAAVMFGSALSNYIKLLNQQLIILAGPLIKHSNIFYETAKETAIKKAREYKVEFIRGGYFQNKSMAVGAAYIVLDKVLFEHES